jgi:hypothetical protein
MDLTSLGIAGVVVTTFIVALQILIKQVREALSLTIFVGSKCSFWPTVRSLPSDPVSLRNTNVNMMSRRCRIETPVK